MLCPDTQTAFCYLFKLRNRVSALCYNHKTADVKCAKPISVQCLLATSRATVLNACVRVHTSIFAAAIQCMCECIDNAPRCMFSVSLVLHLLEEHWLDNSFPASSTSDSGSELYVWLRSAVQGPVILKVTEVIEYDICTYTRPYHCWQYQLFQLQD